LKYLLLLIYFGVPPSTQTQNSPKLIHFVPSSYSNSFTLNREPVLKIISGDTVHTTTIDAFGRDKNGIRRQRGGNPLTGPFYIETAMPGDVLVVHLDRDEQGTERVRVGSFPVHPILPPPYVQYPVQYPAHSLNYAGPPVHGNYPVHYSVHYPIHYPAHYPVHFPVYPVYPVSRPVHVHPVYSPAFPSPYVMYPVYPQILFSTPYGG